MLKVQLLSYTSNPESVVATAAHQCVSTDDAHEFFRSFLPGAEPVLVPPEHFFCRALDMGHDSILEHASFTFAISGVSRSLSHQLVRFRIASFAQQSQRYAKIDPGELGVVTPPTIQDNQEALEWYEDFMVFVAYGFKKLTELGIPQEDARFILPNATETALIMTMNARELHHAFNLRCCSHAQWEIRAMFNEILAVVKQTAPALFKNAGPSCVATGVCPEKGRSCGRINQ